MDKHQITEFFKGLSFDAKGLEGWLSNKAHDEVFKRLSVIEQEPLSKVQLNQLLLLSLEAGISDDFFKYYWLNCPMMHPYLVDRIDDYEPEFVENSSDIISLKHLRWGLNRIYTDCLLYFGSINNGFKELKNKTYAQLEIFFKSKSVPTDIVKRRGKPLAFSDIRKDDRYLISEMACKTYGDAPKTASELRDFLLESYKLANSQGQHRVTIKELLSQKFTNESMDKYEPSLGLFKFSTDEIADEMISSETELNEHYQKIADKFLKARGSALHNTDLYLSLVNDLDVYVATSMRTRKDFREMADSCETIFTNSKIQDLHLRYFDPTLSAADGHEDKGLIECLMVKCAKVLVYCAGEKESYGKDAEAAMALSLGKPVIFLCHPETRAEFYRVVHPLSRLIDFNTGVAVGAIVTENIEDISFQISRLLFPIISSKTYF